MTAPALLSREECEALSRRVLELVPAAQAEVQLFSLARSTTEFARGDPHMGSEVTGVRAILNVQGSGRRAEASTNQLTEAGLRMLVAEAEALARKNPSSEDWSLLPPQSYPEGPPIYLSATEAARAPEAQAALVYRAIDAAAAAGLVAAGDVQLEGIARAMRNTAGFFGYVRENYGEVSMTARGAEQHASGWGWSGFEDWSRVDVEAVIRRAVDLARRSANPVAIEPGRYTVILEPTAVAELIHPIIDVPTGDWSAQIADLGGSVFSKEPAGTNKIGLQMMDRRLGMVSSPWDPDRPASTIHYTWVPIPAPVVWFERGVLRNLAYDAEYARQRGREPVINPGGVRLAAEGPSTSLEDMIASTRRGIWVNRLSHLGVINMPTLLLTGTTRDGTFLIENGKITKPIKNFRFTESPFFVFNQLEAWGEPVRASRWVVAPRLLLRDFNFTSLTDAV